MTKIYLDAGHGGQDSGASSNGIHEKDTVLDIANRIERILKNDYENVEIKQTRTSDVFLTLDQRTDRANSWGADCFVSIHCNAASAASAKGFESYIYNGGVSPETVAFQNVMHEEIYKRINGASPDRGKKRNNFHVLRESRMKAILTECFFITNPSDAALLKQGEFREKIAQGHVNGLEKFFGLKQALKPPEDNKGDLLYQVVAGTFANYDNALQRVKQLEADGYNAYIKEK